MKILAIDPSISCTGWALLVPLTDALTLHSFGTIEPDQDSLDKRLNVLYRSIRARMDSLEPTHIVVELPQTVSMGAARNATTLPTYGAAVGTVMGAAFAYQSRGGIEVEGISATEWGRTAKRARGRAGAAKENRLRLVELYFNIDLHERIGNKVSAAGVADAALLGRYYVNNMGVRKAVTA